MKLQLVLFAVFLGQAVSAQDSLGKVTGRLLDPNGALVINTGAVMVLKNSATGAEFNASILPKGNYEVLNLPAGTYDMSVPIACCMYRTYTQKSVTVAAGQTLNLDLHLDWGINLGTIGDDPIMLNNDMRLKAKNTEGPTPRMADGKPDFSGMWATIADASGPPNPFPLKPWAAEIQKKLQESSSYRQGPASYCLPQSAVQITLPFPFKLVQTPNLIVHITEFLTPGYRQIFLDGRGHPKDWNPAWIGHSTGKWEGDTLVVETVGYNEMAAGAGVHTESLKLTERIRRPDKAHLEIDITLEDPEAYTAPWNTKSSAGLIPDEEILEFVCAENNKDPLHFGGLGYRHR